MLKKQFFFTHAPHLRANCSRAYSIE